MTVKFIYGEKEELEKQVARELVTTIKNTKVPKLLLATGKSPAGLYKNVVQLYNTEDISFKDVITFNLDEYINIDKYPNDSFRKYMDDHLFNNIDIKRENIHFPESTETYDKELDENGNFDISILGVGSNGHIAFNEPGSKFETRTNKAVLTPLTIKANFGERIDFPDNALTMGLFDIYHKSNKIILLAWGEEKREALLKLKDGVKDDQWPITHLADHPNISIITDIDGLE